jgi:membrane peptidoglycan carboxypeptidase
MDDIMKDVINRGTAAQAQSWGFRNVPGKTAFAGKTGTSRDGWFAGFTPELVCVVYVGFDENDDLGMKGSDSAMPIWADFMKAALDLHPEWNGDWAMPASVRKAEIDIRNGALVRELDGVETAEVRPVPSVSPTPKRFDPAVDDPDWAVEQPPEIKSIFVSDVPAEFRRVELFIAGTIPNRQLLTEEDMIPESEPNPVQTPLVDALQDHLDSNSNDRSRRRDRADNSQKGNLVFVCPITGMRATVNCPGRESRAFPEGSEPKEFCTFHR